MLVCRPSNEIVTGFNDIIQAWIIAERLNKKLAIVSDDIPYLNPYFDYSKIKTVISSTSIVEYKNLLLPEETNKDLLKYYYYRFFKEIIRFTPRPKHLIKHIVLWGDKALTKKEEISKKYKLYSKTFYRFTDDDSHENWVNFLLLRYADVIVSESTPFIDLVVSTTFDTHFVEIEN